MLTRHPIQVSVIALCGALATACPGRQGETAETKPAATTKAGDDVARWVFHPKGPQRISARTSLPGGELVVDRGGSRWLVPADGPPTPAAYGAPEALIAARAVSGGFAFVGESGSVYVTSEALGPFVSVRRPPEVSFGGAAFRDVVLTVGRDGLLRRTADLGRSWAVVAVDGVVARVAMDNQGRALAVSVPERWFWSTDAGASFRAIAPGPIAPTSLEGGGEQIQAEGWMGEFVFDGTTFRPGAPAERARAAWSLPRSPSAADVRIGHATLARDVVALTSEQGGFGLLRGELGGGSSSKATQGLEGCARFRMARAGKRLAVLCADKAEAGTSIALSLYVGDVDSARFEKQAVVLRGDFEATRLALSAEGTVVLSGVCPEKDRDPGCTARGVHRLSPGARVPEPQPMAFEELPQALAFTTAGRLLVAGVREKDGHALVSLTGADQNELGRLLDLSTELELAERATGVELLVGRGPVTSVIVHRGEGALTASLDESGELVTSGSVPPEAVAVHGAGLHLAAVSPSSRLVYESADGGVTWAPTALPRSLCPGERTDCTPLIACSDAGCLVGDELTRVGWGASEESTLAAQGDAAVPLKVPAASGYSCRIDGAQPLVLRHLFEVPGASEAALGETDFSVVLYDGERVAVDFAWVKRGERRLEYATGLGPVSEPERYAITMVPQVEGAAVLRYRIPVRQTGDRMLSEIEVAWNNRIAGVAAHQRFPSLSESRQGDYHSGTSGPGEAFPQLLSVAGNGLYLALHRADSGEQATYYFEGAGFETLLAARFPPALADVEDAEYVRIDGEHVPLAFAGDRSRVYLGSRGPNLGPGVALLLGETPANVGRAQGMRLSYRGDRIGVVSMMADVDGAFWAARFAELGGTGGEALGEVVPVPLKPALGSAPKACSAAALEETPRVVAPSFPGPNPPLRVMRSSEEVARFVLRSAVLHGTPDDACLAAWAGDPESGSTESGGGVLLLPTGDGLRGWFFSRRDAGSSEGFDAWPLSCELAE